MAESSSSAYLRTATQEWSYMSATVLYRSTVKYCWLGSFFVCRSKCWNFLSRLSYSIAYQRMKSGGFREEVHTCEKFVGGVLNGIFGLQWVQSGHIIGVKNWGRISTFLPPSYSLGKRWANVWMNFYSLSHVHNNSSCWMCFCTLINQFIKLEQRKSLRK